LTLTLTSTFARGVLHANVDMIDVLTSSEKQTRGTTVMGHHRNHFKDHYGAKCTVK